MKTIMTLHLKSTARARAAISISDELEIRVGLHQIYGLSPLLFLLISDAGNLDVRYGVPMIWR